MNIEPGPVVESGRGIGHGGNDNISRLFAAQERADIWGLNKRGARGWDRRKQRERERERAPTLTRSKQSPVRSLNFQLLCHQPLSSSFPARAAFSNIMQTERMSTAIAGGFSIISLTPMRRRGRNQRDFHFIRQSRRVCVCCSYCIAVGKFRAQPESFPSRCRDKIAARLPISCASWNSMVQNKGSWEAYDFGGRKKSWPALQFAFEFFFSFFLLFFLSEWMMSLTLLVLILTCTVWRRIILGQELLCDLLVHCIAGRIE